MSLAAVVGVWTGLSPCPNPSPSYFSRPKGRLFLCPSDNPLTGFLPGEDNDVAAAQYVNSDYVVHGNVGILKSVVQDLFWLMAFCSTLMSTSFLLIALFRTWTLLPDATLFTSTTSTTFTFSRAPTFCA